MAFENTTRSNKELKCEDLYCSGRFYWWKSAASNSIINKHFPCRSCNSWKHVDSYRTPDKKEKTLFYAPSKRLFSCLATTDLCVGLVSHPLLFFTLISLTREPMLCVITTICLTISSVCYTTIFKKLRRRGNQVQIFERSVNSSSCESHPIKSS